MERRRLHLTCPSPWSEEWGPLQSTSITLTAHYNSNPPPGVLPTDTELKNVLTLAL